jgi:hypothetical protein
MKIKIKENDIYRLLTILKRHSQYLEKYDRDNVNSIAITKEIHDKLFKQIEELVADKYIHDHIDK